MMSNVIPGGLDIEIPNGKPKPSGSTQRPTIGRQVHFVDENTDTGDLQCRTATIVRVWSTGDPELDPYRSNPLYEVEEMEPLFGVPNGEWVALHVLVVYGCASLPFVCHDEVVKAGRTWHWPEGLPSA